ncbi:DUF2946 domain-containing protein [Massilia cavernae]|uniref:DUF2946 domain-containing protein n=1 Tax=Massilia cavernae TaxID=2320864 RepID=A0A418X7K7_9BURK|nr:DUF2946 domain-containing protein [Massilia cavernae]RJG08469.1 DUF2946 domain-containing protein [Massilia cavernae]
MTRLTRRFATWLAFFAIVFAALAPSVSHAFAAAQGGTWTEICTTSGSKFVKVSDDVQLDIVADSVSKQTLHLEHCPFCATGDGSFALLPGTAFTMPMPAQPDIRPFLFYQAPSPLAIWSTAQSRAPPANT